MKVLGTGNEAAINEFLDDYGAWSYRLSSWRMLAARRQRGRVAEWVCRGCVGMTTLTQRSKYRVLIANRLRIFL